jgi:hypothetical protein
LPVLQQATAVPRKRRADLPLCWDIAEDLLQMETALRRALCCLPESIETVRQGDPVTAMRRQE